MEIPPNILKELEEKKAQSFLGGNRTDTPSLTDVATETPQRMTFVPPSFSPVNPVSHPLLEADPHHHSGGELLFEFLSKVAIYLAVFLTPILFFNSSDAISLSKQLMLSVLALTAMMAWVGKTIASGKLVWRKNFMLWPVVFMAGAALASSIFSSSFWISFLGDAGRFTFAGASILSYLIIFLAAFQVLTKKDLKIVLGLWLSSAFLALAYALLQFFGIYLIPQEIYKAKTFNSIGSSSALALFALSVVPFVIALIQNTNARLVKILLAAVGLAGFLVGTIVGFQSGWIILALAALVLILMNFKKSAGEHSGRGYQKSVLLPLVVIMLAAVFWFVGPLPVTKDINFPAEVSPSYGTSWNVMVQSLKAKPVFGSGLETFSYVYAKFKSADLNQTDYWGVNFNDATNEFITWVTTAGIFGTLAWLLFVAVFFMYAFRKIAEGDPHGLRAGVFASWIFILASKVFYATPMALEFFFWLLPVFFFLSTPDVDELKGWKYYFQSGSTKTLLMFFVMMMVLLGAVAGVYLSARRWQAEMSFVSALTLPNTAEKRDEATNAVYAAITADPYESRYFSVLARVLFAKMNDVVSEIQKRPQGQNTAKPEEATLLQKMTVQTVNSIQRATQLDPQNVSVVLDAAQSYSGLAPMVQGADDLAIQLYEKAAGLEPINPFIRTQLAQTYLVKSNLLGGNSQINDDFVKKAKGALDEALKLNPNYANAAYFYALIKDKEGDKDEALKIFTTLASANPDNQLLKQIISNMQSGYPALGLPPAAATPPQSPTAEPAQGVPSSQQQKIQPVSVPPASSSKK